METIYGNSYTMCEEYMSMCVCVCVCVCVFVCLGKNSYCSDTAFIYTENRNFLFYWVSPLICALGRKEITFLYLRVLF